VGYKTKRSVKMKKNVLSAWIPAIMLVFGMTFCGCEKRSADGSVLPGSITIIGIKPQYNGQYAALQSPDSAEPEGDGYIVIAHNDNGTAFDGALITEGSATIPVYLVPYDSSQFELYSGTDSVLKIRVKIKPYLP
jgi:hypothetical protein